MKCFPDVTWIVVDVTEKCLCSFYLFNETWSLHELIPFPLKEASSNSHILSIIRWSFTGHRLKLGHTRYKQLKGKWSLTSAKINVPTLRCRSSQHSQYGQGRAAQWARRWALISGQDNSSSSCFVVPGSLMTVTGASSCCAGKAYKCVSSWTEPHPAHLYVQFQLSNMFGNSTLRVPLHLLGSGKVRHTNNS